jgi:hypothetical protein
MIVERQDAEGWGKAVVENLATDLRAEFPGVGGFSASNLWRMKGFFERPVTLAQGDCRTVGGYRIVKQKFKVQPYQTSAVGCLESSAVAFTDLPPHTCI